MFGIDDAALAILAAGAIGTAGQLYANTKNIGATKSINEANLAMAALNNATQIDMANTAHQREVLDLRKAGLNPILSAGGNGASTPTLQSARLDAAQIENPVQSLGQSAQAMAHYMSDNYKAQVADSRAVADYDRVLADRARAELPAEQKKAYIENAATDAAFGLSADSNGNFHIDDPEQFGKSFKVAKQAVISDIKNRANQNWRGNLDSLSRGVNSASTLINAINPLKRGRR